MVGFAMASGRPTKLTAAVQEKICTAIRAGNYAVVAACYAGISEHTFYEWMKRGAAGRGALYAAFHQAVKDAEAAAETYAVAQVRNAAAENWTAAAWYLERKFSKRWGRRDVVEHEGTDDAQGEKPIRILFGGRYREDGSVVTPPPGHPGREE
jgi:hypothetical protein